MEKTCTECKCEKPLELFYLQPSARDGRAGICKECHKSRVRANRAANIERYREYDRGRSGLPHRVNARKDYAELVKATPHLRQIANQRSKAWIERNAEKRAAHVAVGNAVRDGVLLKQPCENCGKTQTDAHHDDYKKPLDVQWFCKPCHAKHHALLRAEQRAAAKGEAA
jgi:hypothetical protein